MKKNDLLELKIHDINNLGAGVAKAENGMTVFVNGAVDGDLVLAKIIKVASDYAVARVERIITPSDYRIESDCPVSKRCGGCVYRNITYEHEKELKHRYVHHAFIKAGVADAKVMPVASDKEAGYRNKVQYPFSSDLDVGFFANHTHTVISGTHDCRLQNPAFEPIIDTVVDFVKAKKLSAYDESTGRGLLRHLFLRIGEKTGQIMVMLVINGDKLPFSDEFCKILTKKHENVVSVMINVNKARTNVILSKDVRDLWGKDHIEDELCGVRLKISALSFYQVNRGAAELLYKKAAELADLKDGDRLLDLFCGVGSVGLSMKNIAKNEIYANISLKGVEIIDDAVKAARENAALSGLEGEFVCSDANGEALENCDIVVLDPPRKGVEKRLIQQLSDKNINSIVYISCGPDTLARDCKAFLELGYEMSEVYLFDLFPRTGHVESVVCLSRENSDDCEVEPKMISDERSKYKSWSNLKKQMNDLLCDSLKDKISYFYTSYHEVHNAYGRATIQYEKKEIVAFSWDRQYEQVQDIKEQYRKMDNVPSMFVDYEGSLNAYKVANVAATKEKWMPNCTLCETDFLNSLTIYLKTDIAAALHSDNYLLRVFAYMDRRVGKRTLVKIQDEVEKLPDWVKQFYQIRCEADGIVFTSE